MSICTRVYKDYIRLSQLKRYEDFLSSLKGEGFLSVRLIDVKNNKHELPKNKIVVLRHDIDSDLTTAYKMFLIEKKLGIKGTYFFRKSTLDFSFMSELLRNGFEVGYHYEELATWGKSHGLKTQDEVSACMMPIKKVFCENYLKIKQKLGLDVMPIAAHGDFFNRCIGVLNNFIIDEEFKRINQIPYEAYDSDLLSFFDLYQSDASCLHSYPKSQIDYIFKSSRICLLIHPRQWNADFIVNLKLDTQRVFEYLVWNVNKLKASIKKLKKKLDDILIVLRSPTLGLNFGKLDTKTLTDYWQYATSSHPRFPLLKRKTFGVMVINFSVFECYDSYLDSVNGKNSAAYYSRKALKRNYYFKEINPSDYLNDLNDINFSSEVRQGRRMSEEYRESLQSFKREDSYRYFGVVNTDNKLLAYCFVVEAKDFAFVSKILGHKNYLNDGVMYLLVLKMVEFYWKSSKCKYFIYDMFLGASSGLRMFKEKLGFKPYRVRWICD